MLRFIHIAVGAFEHCGHVRCRSELRDARAASELMRRQYTATDVAQQAQCVLMSNRIIFAQQQDTEFLTSNPPDTVAARGGFQSRGHGTQNHVTDIVTVLIVF